MSEMYIADTPEKIEHYRMAAAIAALRFETKTGMKMGRHSVLAFVKAQYGIKAGTKKKALAELEDYYEATYGMRYGVKHD